MQTNYVSIFLTALLISGCQSNFGPSALNNTHIPYNQAISETLNQQMLLNLVRLKYRDGAYYLGVGNVTASLDFGVNAGIGSNVNMGPSGNVMTSNLGMSYNDSPTISFQPLQGEAFFKSVLTQLPIGTLVLLGTTGWNIDDILGLCVDEINGIENAAKASGVTPKFAPKYQEFARVQFLFRELQMQRSLKIGASSKEKGVLMKFTETPQNTALLSELMTLLGLPTSTRLVKLDNAEFLDVEKDNDTLTIYTKSIANILSYLAQNVQVPPEHIEKGLVTITKTADGNTFNWSETPAGKLLTVKSSKSRPDNAFLTVAYKDYWYYIADDDLKSKSTFMLLNQLFNYQSGHSVSQGPVLTIPVK
jgi:hypothetical protein